MKQIIGVYVTIFTFFIITNFKTDRYPNNFQEHLFTYISSTFCFLRCKIMAERG